MGSEMCIRDSSERLGIDAATIDLYRESVAKRYTQAVVQSDEFDLEAFFSYVNASFVSEAIQWAPSLGSVDLDDLEPDQPVLYVTPHSPDSASWFHQLAMSDAEFPHGGLSLSKTPEGEDVVYVALYGTCLLYTSPSPRDATLSRMPSSA